MPRPSANTPAPAPGAGAPGPSAPGTPTAATVPRPRRVARPGAAPGGTRAGAGGAVGYVRRSTDKQEQSIADQQRAIERFCAEQGISLLRWYIDDAISGTRTANRPAFQEMIAAATEPNRRDFSFVVVYDVKRFGRLDNDEAGYYRHLLRSAGVEVLYVSESFDGGDTDDLLRPVKQWQARQESTDLAKVTTRGHLSRVGRGVWRGGAPPLGYDLRYESDRGEFLFIVRFEPDGSKRVLGKDGQLQRTLERGESIAVSKRDVATLTLSGPERVEAVRWMFRMYTQEGRGLKTIADALNRAEVPTARGPGWSAVHDPARGIARGWTCSTVRAILVNPIYAGDMVWNRRTDARFHRISDGRAVERRAAHGARLVPNPEEDWIFVRDAHEPVISREVWEQACAIREGRASVLAAAGTNLARRFGRQQCDRKPIEWSGMRAQFLLSGLIKCGRCGCKYQGVTRVKGKPRVDGSRVKTRSYACGGYISKGRSACVFGPVPQDWLEQRVIDEVLRFYTERYLVEGGMDRLAREVREALGHEAVDLADAQRRLDEDRTRVEGTIANLLDNLSNATRDLAEERLATLRVERERLARRAEELERLSLNEGRVRDTTHEVGTFLAGLDHTLRHAPGEHRKAAVRRCVEGITVRSDGEAIDLQAHTLTGLISSSRIRSHRDRMAGLTRQRCAWSDELSPLSPLIAHHH